MIRSLVAVLALAPVASAACEDGSVALRGDWGTARFSVEVADEPRERAQGLMFVEQMPQSTGMLFVYPAPQVASFWMKNTLIPLDMIFADASGTVQAVHVNAIPGDETPILGGYDIQYVLEINGGLAAAMGIVAGSEMQHPAIDQVSAAWPCGD